MSDFFNRAWFVAWYSQIITINIPIMYAILAKTKKALQEMKQAPEKSKRRRRILCKKYCHDLIGARDYL